MYTNDSNFNANEHFDIVVIGSGVGGLAAVERLGRLTKDLNIYKKPSILLLDSNKKPGGVVDFYTRGNHEFGTAISYLMHAESPLEGPLAKEKLTPTQFRIELSDEKSLELSTDAEEAFRVLVKTFPEDRDALAKIFDYADEVSESLRNIVARMRDGEDITLDNCRSEVVVELNNTPINVWLNKMGITNSELQKALTIFVCSGISTPPSELPALLWIALFFSMHSSKNKYVGYLEDKKVVKRYFDAIGNYSVSIRQGSKVEKILLDGGRKVSGVKLGNGSIISCHYLVSTSSMDNNLELIGKENLPSEFLERVKSCEPSLPYLTYNAGINNSSLELQSILGSDSPNISIAHSGKEHLYCAKTLDDLKKVNMSFTFYNTNSVKSHFHIVIVADPQLFKSKDRKEYISKKKEAISIISGKIDNLYPGLNKLVEVEDLLTSESYKKYNLSQTGSPFGYKATCNNGGLTRFSQKGPISGLFFAGADTKLCGGVTGSLFTGEVAAMLVLKQWKKDLRDVNYNPFNMPKPLMPNNREADEPIAIVGMGCRFPGSVSSPEEFWDFLTKGKNGIKIVPEDRWDAKMFTDPTGTLPGKVCTNKGGFIDSEEWHNFDARFFGISPREAYQMDAQQRLLLKMCFEAIEDAGIVIPSPALGSDSDTIPEADQEIKGIKDNNISVFIGASNIDHSSLTFNHRHGLDTHSNPGSSSSILANRLSYIFNLRGPSSIVDTACSSSIVALHMACETLRRKGEQRCSAAIAGGINILMRPNFSVGFSKLGVLSKNGESKPFDSEADGYVRSEGGGIVVLKRLSQAIADNDRIYATIYGTEMNSDGHSVSGMTNPSTHSQVDLLRSLYNKAKIAPKDVDYVEAHGTGTPVGDPAEANALGRFFTPGRSVEHPLLIGSVKSNVGHLESAAGIAGLIKSVLSIHNGQIPPSINIKNINPKIDMKNFSMQVVRNVVPWPDNKTSRIARLAGINSFGFGGANASAILGKDEFLEQRAKRSIKGNQILLITARSVTSLMNSIGKYRDFLLNVEDEDYSDICFTSLTRRTHHKEYRLVCITDSPKKAASLLTTIIETKDRSNIEENTKSSVIELKDDNGILEIYGNSKKPESAAQMSILQTEASKYVSKEEFKTTFVFSGQGSQWKGMVVDIIENVKNETACPQELYLYEIMQNIDSLLEQEHNMFNGSEKQEKEPLPYRSVLEELSSNPGNNKLDDTEIAQRSIFAIEVALAKSLIHLGIKPSFCVGHSVGEVAAAYISGVLSLEDACIIMYHRSRLQQHNVPKNGSMIAVNLSLSEAKNEIIRMKKKYNDTVLSISAWTGSTQVTISGDSWAIDLLCKDLKSRNIRCKVLPVAAAFHSSHMDLLKDEFCTSIEGRIKPSSPKVAAFKTGILFRSTVLPPSIYDDRSYTCGEIIDTLTMDEKYWFSNIREPVFLVPTIEYLTNVDGANSFVEVGPSAVLTSSLIELTSSHNFPVLPTFKRNVPAKSSLLLATAKIASFLSIRNIKWEHFFSSGHLISLPSYSWDEKRFWLDGLDQTDGLRKPVGTKGHPLAYSRMLQSPIPAWVTELDVVHIPWVKDHIIQGNIVLPGVAYLETFCDISTQLQGNKESGFQKPFEITNVQFKRALYLEEDSVHRYQTSAESIGNNEYRLSIHSHTEPHPTDDHDFWEQHCTGKLKLNLNDRPTPEPFDVNALKQLCNEEIDRTEFYSNLYDDGFELGPCFTRVKQVWASPDRRSALSIVSPGNELLKDELNLYTILHPALFDSSIQSALAMRVRHGAFLPVQVESLQVWSSPKSSMTEEETSEGIEYGIYAEANENYSDSMSANITLFNFKTGRIFFQLWGLSVKYLEENNKRNVYGINFLPQAVQHYSVSSEVDPGMIDIVNTSIQKEKDRQVEESNNFLNTGLNATALDHKLIVLYIRKALIDLNVSEVNMPGCSVKASDLIQKYKISEKHSFYFSRMLSILANEDFLQGENSSYVVLNSVYSSSLDEEINSIEKELFSKYIATRCNTLMLSRCGRKLVDILLEKEDPIGLLFTDDLISKMYRDSPQFHIYSLLIAKAIKNVSSNSDKLLSILEVGGGTGGTTSFVLPNLPQDNTRYLFTDLSSVLVKKAKDEFCGIYPFVDFQTLDIESQTNLDERFDIIIESNCYHAVGNLEMALSNSYKLLKPGGVIIMMEVFESIWSEFVFGLTSGWWLFKNNSSHDEGLREERDYPTLNNKEWKQLLQTAGFREPSSFGFEGTAWEKGQFIITAEKPKYSDPVEHNSTSSSTDSIIWFSGSTSKKTQPLKEDLSRSNSVFSVTEEAFNNVDILVNEIVDIIENNLSCEVFHIVCPQNYHDFGKFLDIDSEELMEIQRHLLQPLQILNKALYQINLDYPEKIQLLDLVVVTENVYKPYNYLTKGNINPSESTVIGFMRVFSSELSNIGIKLVDCSLGYYANKLEMANLHNIILNNGNKNGGCIEFCIRNQTVYELEVRKYENIENLPLIIGNQESKTSGRYHHSLQKLGKDHYINIDIPSSIIPDDHVGVKVSATGINYRDIMLAKNLLNLESTTETLYEDKLGLEFAGVITEVGKNITDSEFKVGDRVMGFAKNSIATNVVVLPDLICKIPEHLNFQEAATIPMAYCTAYYALKKLARIQKGDNVLIQAAAGGVGLAAVNLCNFWGANPIGTSRKEFKRQILKSLCNHVLDSSNTSFAEELLELYPNGIDIVLNSLAGKYIPAGINCLAQGGRFIEIGKQDIYADNELKLKAFKNNISFSALTIDKLMVFSPKEVGMCLREVAALFSKGNKIISPLPMHLKSFNEYENAFKLMAESNHVGKIVLSRALEDSVCNEVSVPAVTNNFNGFRKDCAYLIIGGTGGLGISMARYLAQKGAGVVILSSRSGGSKEIIDDLLRIEEQYGTKIIVQKADWTSSVNDLIKSTKDILSNVGCKLCGVVNLAMVLKDQFIRSLKWSEIEIPVRAKVASSFNALKVILSLEEYASVEFFLMTSSVNSHIGPPGQANYAAGNVFLEALTNYARLLPKPIPTFCVNLPVVGDIGYVHRNDSVRKILSSQGVLAKTSKQICSWIFEKFIPMGVVPNAGFYELEWEKMFRQVPGISSQTRLEKFYETVDESPGNSGSGGGKLIDIIEECCYNDGLDAAKDKISQGLVKILSTILSIPMEQMEKLKNESLNSLGIDSMMSVELKKWVDIEFRTNIPVVNIVRGPSISQFTLDLFKLTIESKKISLSQSDNSDEKENIFNEKELLEAPGIEVSNENHDIVRFVELKRKYPLVKNNDEPEDPFYLFCIPYHRGTEMQFDGWIDQLPDFVVPVCITLSKVEEYSGIFGAAEIISDKLHIYLRQNKIQRYAMFGHSIGAYLSYGIARNMEKSIPPIGLSLAAVPPVHTINVEDVPPSLPERFLTDEQDDPTELLENPVLVDVLQIISGEAEKFSGTSERMALWQDVVKARKTVLIESIDAWHYFMTSRREQTIGKICDFIIECTATKSIYENQSIKV